MGCNLSTAYPRGLRFKRKKNKISKVKIIPGEKPTKEDPNRSSPAADASDGPAIVARDAKKIGNWSVVGIGGTTRSEDILCPVERPDQIPGLVGIPHGELITQGDEFGFANVQLQFPKYRIQESASSLDLSAGRSNGFGNPIATNAKFRPTFNGYGFNRPRQDPGQESVFMRRLLTVRAEKKEMEKNLDLWLHMQEEKDKEKVKGENKATD